MGSKGEKKNININVKAILNVFAILIVIPVLFNLAINKGLVKASRDLLFGIYSDAYENPYDFVEFLNVGQADCTLIKSGNSVAVIDFGVEEDGETLYRKLLKYGIKSIDLAVITHHHSDHMGGFLRVASKIQIKNFVINNSTAEDGEGELYGKVIALAKSNQVKIHSPKVGSSFKIGNAVLKVLSCNTSAEEENNRSIVTMLTISGKKVLFTGDADNEVERYIADNCDIKCDILKMGHHGSDSASNTHFLKTAAPEIAVVSCGYDNIYKHPSEGAVLRANKLGIKVYRTDLDRSIRCNFDSKNKTYSITTERGEAN